jgi:hypothetical protein
MVRQLNPIRRVRVVSVTRIELPDDQEHPLHGS